MKKRIVVGVLTFIFIVSLILSMYFILDKNMALFMGWFVICVFCFVCTVSYISYNKNMNENFESNVNNILRLYDSILIKSGKYPDLENKKINRLNSIEELIDTQLEIKKPIYYIKQVTTCSFILLNNKEAYVYIMKRSPDDVAALDIIIKDLEILKKQEERRRSASADLLDNIDRTTIIKMSNTRKFKVSPIREESMSTKSTKSTKTTKRSSTKKKTTTRKKKTTKDA